MAWSTPLTAVANAALTASQWNASVRDNLNETAVAKVTAGGQYVVSTALNTLAARTPQSASNTAAESTTSTSYAAPTSGTAGPSVTATTGTKALVSLSLIMQGSAAGVEVYASYAISGATTLAAADEQAARFQAYTTSARARCGIVDFPTLTAGSNTFTQQFKVSSGSANLDDRVLVVLPY